MKMNALGYEFIRKDQKTGLYLLRDTSTNTLEWWAANKRYAGFTVPYRNTELEFCGTADESEAPF